MLFIQVDVDSHGREVEKYDRNKLRSWKKAKVTSFEKVLDIPEKRDFQKKEITNESSRWCTSREGSLVKWGKQLLYLQTRRLKRKRCSR